MSKKISSNNTFKFVGELDYDKEKFFNIYDSPNWEIARISFSVICGSNRHYVQAVGFKPKDPDKEIVYFTKDKENNFKRIAFARRNSVNKSNLGYQQPKLDLGGEETRFVTTYDYVMELQSLFINGKHKNITFQVRGNMEYDSYQKDGELRETEKYIVTEVAELPLATKPMSYGFYKIYLPENAFEKVGEKGVLTGKSVVYKKENGEEKYYGYNTSIEIDLGENIQTSFDFLKKRYKGSDTNMGRIGIMCEIVNGFDEIPFTEDMLTDTEKEAIALGIDSFEDIKRSKGTGKGELVKCLRRVKEMKGYTDGSEETALSLNDLVNNSTIIDYENESPDSFSAVDDDDIPF